ncbi:flagellar hook-associated protein FlgK [Alicyclobacillus mali]|uniref:Flagellar hook-associated protein 1 n=1 Tax=Alicyclobacillus mali (ex Roth et al. 2021) TaxID=1123961 RepID=A0ABS0F424_9BACL|nr:flagellar hook-associated protein FlgK [Alicyclobacillus mali (ex Roth et al. 2021)]MBF8378070.1 flagellar hook-associated protein FlgK [Alicyclobacillus mali (ex Roth et al. 2021)]
MGIPTFSPLYVGLSGLQAMQEAQSVVGNNIDNANTPGYAQESVNFVEANPYPPIPGPGPFVGGQFGQGVLVQSVTRQDDWFYDEQDWANQSTYQMYTTFSTVLTQVEGIVNEPSSTSLQNALDQFFSAWQTLSTDPSNTGAKQAVISQGQVLAQTFNMVSSQLQSTQQDVLNQVNSQFQQLQQYAQQLSAIQTQIQKIAQQNVSGSPVSNPNTLLDEQSAIIGKMSQLANLTLSQNADGTISVSVGSGPQAISMAQMETGATVSDSGGQLQLTIGSQTVPLSSVVQGGQIAGNAQGYGEISGLLNQLTQYEDVLASKVNAALGNQTFFDAPSSGGSFAVDAGMTVATLQTGPSGASGDNRYALNVVNLQTTPTPLSWVDGTGSTQTESGTFDQLLGSMVSQLGTLAAGVSQNATTANALLQQSTQLRQSVSSVSIDEQATYMIAFQNAYSAAAKYIATFQTMLNSLMNMVQS